MKLQPLFLLAFISASAIAADFTPYGVPEPQGTKTMYLIRSGYAVKYFNQCHVPFYSAEHLEGKNVGGTEPRWQFREDQDIPVEDRATNGDYLRSGYDKGHMAPAADFQESHEEMGDSFLLSNAVPQIPKLNRGVWKAIEIRVRAYAVKLSDVYVITGGIYSSSPAKIGNGVCVPSYTYKVVIDKKSGQSIGFIAPNVKDISGTPEKFQVPVSMIEKETGINFTPDLSSKQAGEMKDSIGNSFIVK